MKGFLHSFVCAGRGIGHAIWWERNLRFHLCFAVLVYALSVFYPFGRLEYALLTAIIGGVLALELINSAIERTVDRVGTERHPLAGLAKDIAAGAVLVYCIGAAICGIVLFWDVAVLGSILARFAAQPWLLLPLAAALTAMGWFVFRFGRKREQ